ncbi:MAG: hypothetical protein ACJ799_13815, partial [Gemmatimonadaceae bacterium]
RAALRLRHSRFLLCSLRFYGLRPKLVYAKCPCDGAVGELTREQGYEQADPLSPSQLLREKLGDPVLHRQPEKLVALSEEILPMKIINDG